MSEIVNLEESKKRAFWDWIKLCGIQAVFWSVCTTHGSFLVSFLKNNGYSTTVTARIVLMNSIVNLISPTIFGYISDLKLGIKKTMILCFALSIPMLCLMPISVHSLLFTVLANLLYNFFEQPLSPLTDAITNLSALRNKYVVYGFTRGCGSFSAAICSWIIGDIINVTGLESLFYIEAGMMVIPLILMIFFKGEAYGIENPPPFVRQNKKDRVSFTDAIKILAKEKNYVYLTICLTLLNVSARLASLYLPILIQENGGDSSDIGFALFLNCILMAPCMILHSKLERRGVSNDVTLIISAIFATLRLVCMALSNNVTVIIWAQLLQSFGYGFMQPSTVRGLCEVSPIEVRATAFSLSNSIKMVLSTIIGGNIASRVADIIGIRNTFIIFAFVTISGLIFYIPIMKSKKLGEAK